MNQKMFSFFNINLIREKYLKVGNSIAHFLEFLTINAHVKERNTLMIAQFELTKLLPRFENFGAHNFCNWISIKILVTKHQNLLS